MSKKPKRPLTERLKPFVAPFRFDGSGEFHLKLHKAGERGGLDKDEGEKIIEANRQRLSDLQEKLYANDRWSLLVIFQGMDASGKDSAIKSIFEGVNPQGCEVTSFKQPTAHELDHDFMWRAMIALPERGHIGIFNRSYYEECLITRVHHDLLAKEKLPSKLISSNIWQERFADIAAFERYLSRNGTVVLKFHLRISRDEQRKRFLSRLDEPDKRWKFSASDAAERAYWDDYMAAYEDMIRETSTDYAPWYVVPAYHKHVAWLVVSAAIIEALDALKLQYPKVTGKALKEQKKAERKLRAEKPAGANAGKTSKKR